MHGQLITQERQRKACTSAEWPKYLNKIQYLHVMDFIGCNLLTSKLSSMWDSHTIEQFWDSSQKIYKNLTEKQNDKVFITTVQCKTKKRLTNYCILKYIFRFLLSRDSKNAEMPCHFHFKNPCSDVCVTVCVVCGNAEMTEVVSRLRDWITVLHETGNPSKKFKFQKPEKSKRAHNTVHTSVNNKHIAASITFNWWLITYNTQK